MLKSSRTLGLSCHRSGKPPQCFCLTALPRAGITVYPRWQHLGRSAQWVIWSAKNHSLALHQNRCRAHAPWPQSLLDLEVPLPPTASSIRATRLWRTANIPHGSPLLYLPTWLSLYLESAFPLLLGSSAVRPWGTGPLESSQIHAASPISYGFSNSELRSLQP